MLNEEEKQEIMEKLETYPVRRAGCIEALAAVQRRRGWVSDESVRDIGALLEMTAAEVDSVATFYNFIFRGPVGRHVVLLCDSASCWIMGCDSLIEYLKKKLDIAPGGTTRDGRYTLLPNVCLGACDEAPVMMVDDVLFGKLTPEKIDEILERFQ